LGIAVPGKLAIAGYGDLDFAEQMQPTLTTIRVGGYEIGRNAGRLMLARLSGKSVEHPVIDMPVLLEARRSTERI
jgi:LacI family gluconate utilization system Gnt-I transcriptional repressor